MKALIIFDSNYGNTKLIADYIAKQLGNDTLSVSVKDIKEHYLDGINLLIVGSPINGWRPTQKIFEFLDHLDPVKMKGIKSGAFDTRLKLFISGNAAKKIAKALQNSGANVIVPPIGFYVKGSEGPLLEGEMKRVEEWVKLIRSKL